MAQNNSASPNNPLSFAADRLLVSAVAVRREVPHLERAIKHSMKKFMEKSKGKSDQPPRQTSD